MWTHFVSSKCDMDGADWGRKRMLGLEVGNGLGRIKSGGQRRLGSKTCFLVQPYCVRVDLAEWKGCIWPVRSL